MHQPEITLWCQHLCPACGAVNWTCHGSSLSDSTDGDVDACECRSCGVIYWLMDEDIAIDIHQGDLDSATVAKGKERP